MFTILWKMPGGIEEVYEAPSVNRSGCGVSFMRFENQTDSHYQTIDYGDVYVMNSAGKTVATYHLGLPSDKGLGEPVSAPHRALPE